MKRIFRAVTVVVLVFALCLSLASCSELLGMLKGYLPGEQPAAPQAPTPTEGELAVHFLDVGQADAILVVDGDKTLMIDTGDWPNGEDKEFMLSYISNLGIETIDYLVLTHPDADHIGGAPEVISAFRVENCIMPSITKETSVFERTLDALEENEVNVLLPIAGDEYVLKNAAFRILGPLKDDYSDTNDHSVVLRLQYGQRSILFAGDAEKASEEDMMELYGGSQSLKADVLKVGHHGSGTSSSQAFLSLVDPDYAVISCGFDNKYGHPHAQTLTRLNAMGISLYRTDTDGTVVLLTDGETLNFTKLGKREQSSAALAPYTVEYLYFSRKLSAIIAMNSLFVGLPREF